MKSLKSIFLRPGASFPSLLGILLLIAACNNTSECKNDGLSYRTCSNRLVCQNSPQQIAADGTATLTFYAYWDWEAVSEGEIGNGPDRGLPVTFTCSNGTCTASAETEFDGTVICTFKTDDPQNFKGATVTAKAQQFFHSADGRYDEGGVTLVAVGVIQGLNGETPNPEPIQKAEALRENTYSIQKAGGEAAVFNLPQQFSSWYQGTSWTDGTKQVIHVECMDEDENDMTQGWLNGEIPPEVANKLTTINQEFYEKYPWAGAKLGTTRLGQDNMLDAHFGEGGNVKLDGSSQFWLKEKSGTKGYSGQYQLLFVLVFGNWTYDSETDTYIPDGDEYTLCVNATLDQLVADLSDFRMDYPSNWVAPGQSIILTASWTAGASFDWSKVTLNSQTRNGYSGEWFSWDASTQKLTATQSADNQEVKLTFGYAGTDMTSSITLYNGPGYTSFSLSPKEGSADFVLVENDPAYGWSSDDIWFTADEWTPEAYSFNGYGIEIDPATKNYDKLYYNPYGKYVSFRKGIPEGDFDLIFRSVTDHSVKCTIPVKVVNHKAISFQITYKHKNGAFEPWTSGGENGICIYGMGMEVGVITEPKDAYWNWSDVELIPGYDNTFSFSGLGGRDDHPKLQLKTSHGSEILGSQVIFRLKWDNRKKSTIYVDHN